MIESIFEAGSRLQSHRWFLAIPWGDPSRLGRVMMARHAISAGYRPDCHVLVVADHPDGEAPGDRVDDLGMELEVALALATAAENRRSVLQRPRMTSQTEHQKRLRGEVEALAALAGGATYQGLSFCRRRIRRMMGTLPALVDFRISHRNSQPPTLHREEP